MEFVFDKRFIVGLVLGLVLCHFVMKGSLSLKRKGSDQ